MICSRCKVIMKNKMHFEEGRNFKFCECPKCHDKTKTKRINFENILAEDSKSVVNKEKKYEKH